MRASCLQVPVTECLAGETLSTRNRRLQVTVFDGGYALLECGSSDGLRIRQTSNPLRIDVVGQLQVRQYVDVVVRSASGMGREQRSARRVENSLVIVKGEIRAFDANASFNG